MLKYDNIYHPQARIPAEEGGVKYSPCLKYPSTIMVATFEKDKGELQRVRELQYHEKLKHQVQANIKTERGAMMILIR